MKLLNQIRPVLKKPRWAFPDKAIWLPWAWILIGQFPLTSSLSLFRANKILIMRRKVSCGARIFFWRPFALFLKHALGVSMEVWTVGLRRNEHHFPMMDIPPTLWGTFHIKTFATEPLCVAEDSGACFRTWAQYTWRMFTGLVGPYEHNQYDLLHPQTSGEV